MWNDPLSLFHLLITPNEEPKLRVAAFAATRLCG
jgi:hypothetical protein